MSYYDALIAKWPSLGAAVIAQSAIDAATAARATAPPVPPVRPTGAVTADVAQAYADASSAYDRALAAWHWSYASIFHDPAVLAKLSRINALTIAGPRRPVAIPAVMEYLRSNNLWLPIKAAQATSAGAAAAVDYNADLRAASVDFDLPIVKGMLADLVAHSLLTQAQSDAVDALATSQLPWWKSAGYASPIGTGDLEAVFVETGSALV